VFAGGCTLSAVERVCDDETLGVDAIAGTEALLDASLLMRDDSGRSDGEPRLRMLETVRELAFERLLAAPGDLAARVFDRHRAWALSLATSFAGQLTGPSQRDALGALAAEHPNLLAAFSRIVTAGDARAALAFAAAIWRYWLVRRNLAEGRELVDRALDLEAPPGVESLRADAMLGAGQLAQNNGDIAGAAGYFTAVLGIRRQLGDMRGEARALADLGWMEWRRCDFPEARRLSEESLALARQVGDTTVAALALGNIGFVCHCEGKLDAASNAFRDAIALRESLADRRGVAFMRTAMAWTMCRGNRLADARAMLDDALVVHRELGDERLEAFALNVLVDVDLRAGDVAGARSILARTLPSMRRIGDRWAIAHGLWLSSRAELLDGNLDDARRTAVESLALRRQIADRFGEAEAIVALANGLRPADRLDDAGALFREARDIRVAIGDRLGIEECDGALLELTANRAPECIPT
jgi:tetratricopeptide (TPR) repeat protein